MKINQNSKLYNVIFPIWLLWLFPITWIVVLPANFLIDLTVILLTFKFLKISEIKKITKSIILKVWIFGFIADSIGTIFMFSVNIINFDYQTPLGKWWYEIMSAVNYNPFENIYAFLWTTFCLIITSSFIYLFNYKICLKNAELELKAKKKLALSLAIFTTPYLFYMPTAWFF